MNPIIKFTTLFGLLAVELAIELPVATSRMAAVAFFAVAIVFVWRSFYAMRIKSGGAEEEQLPGEPENEPEKARG
jgi:K(+)-stimulated pyrophosphate-energized sodium pump